MAEGDKGKASFRISFDGTDLATHTMNVRDLAPSLLALSDIVSEANQVLNGANARVELHVTPDIHQACFDIGIEIHQQWETLKSLMGDEDISTAKNVIEWLFIGCSVTGGTITSLLYVYKKLRKKRPVNVAPFKDEHGNRLYRYQFDKGNDQILDEKLHLLYGSHRIRRLLPRLLSPILKCPGINDFTAYVDKKSAGLSVTKEEAREFDYEVPEPKTVEPTEDEPFEAILRVYSPVYDLKAGRWRFWIGDKHHYMDVSESNIRRVVWDNGGALVEDRFRVMIKLIKSEDSNGNPVTDYKVLDVLEFIPALRQQDFFLGNTHVDT